MTESELGEYLSRIMPLIGELSVKKQKTNQFVPGATKIRYAQPVIDEEEATALIEAVLEAYLTGWFGLGKQAAEFERSFSRFLSAKYAVFVNSGSSANLLSIAASISTKSLKRGDEVITPAVTFPTTINPLILYGIRPVFIDINLPTYSIKVDDLERAISSTTRGIVLPHLNGMPHEMDAVMEIAEQHDLLVIEDACDALGSKYDGAYVGTFGEMGTFSFYASHHMTTGEGGAVTTNDEELDAALRSLRDWGRASKTIEGPDALRRLEYQSISGNLPRDYELRFTYTSIGYNLKPLDLQAAMGIRQLEKLPRFIEKRKDNYKYLYDGLKRYEDSLILPEAASKADPSWFCFPIVLREEAPFTRKDITTFLESHNVETRPILAGNILKQPAYNRIEKSIVGELGNTELLLKGGFFIGLHPGMGEEQLSYVVDTFNGFMRDCSTRGR